jgi:hypothetical protein
MARPTAGSRQWTPPGRSWQMIRPGSDQMTSSLAANASGKGGSLAVRQPSARHDESRQSLGRRTAPIGDRRSRPPPYRLITVSVAPAATGAAGQRGPAGRQTSRPAPCTIRSGQPACHRQGRALDQMIVSLRLVRSYCPAGHVLTPRLSPAAACLLRQGGNRPRSGGPGRRDRSGRPRRDPGGAGQGWERGPARWPRPELLARGGTPATDQPASAAQCPAADAVERRVSGLIGGRHARRARDRSRPPRRAQRRRPAEDVRPLHRRPGRRRQQAHRRRPRRR